MKFLILIVCGTVDFLTESIVVVFPFNNIITINELGSLSYIARHYFFSQFLRKNNARVVVFYTNCRRKTSWKSIREKCIFTRVIKLHFINIYIYVFTYVYMSYSPIRPMVSYVTFKKKFSTLIALRLVLNFCYFFLTPVYN